MIDEILCKQVIIVGIFIIYIPYVIVFQNRRLHAINYLIIAYCYHMVGRVSFEFNNDAKHTLLSKHDWKSTNDKGVQNVVHQNVSCL